MSGSLIVEVLVFGALWVWVLGLFPAAVICVLKERWLLFVVGWISFGIGWYLGAIPLAEARSGWARRFYSGEKLARAADPIVHRRPGRTTALGFAWTAGLVVVIGLLAARPAPLVGIDGKALQYSVSASIFDQGPCPHKADGSWTCTVPDIQHSSSIPYRVKVGGLGCWTATSTFSTRDNPPRRLKGCITIWDQIRFFEGLL